jgi:Protein of unknown function (DUF3631)
MFLFCSIMCAQHHKRNGGSHIASQIPPILGIDSLAPGPGDPILVVYGERAYTASRATGVGLHWYSKVALPEHLAPEDEPIVAASFAKLVARAVVIWPAAGEAGLARARRDAAAIARAGVTAVGIVTEPAIQLGDPLPPGAPKPSLPVIVNRALAAAKALVLPPLAGRAVQAAPPWLGEADLAQVVEAVCAFVRRFLAEPPATIETIALWCLHAWCARADRVMFDVSPRLIFHAVDARADHARALRLLAWLTPTPLVVSRSIASHVLTAIETDRPTLLIDDVAGGTLYRRDMRALIAAGAYRDGVFLTARSKRNETGRGQCFAPTAVATATALPEDIRLRSIVVPMAPVPMGEARARLTLLEPPPDVFELRAKMQRAVASVTDDAGAFEMLPRSLSTTARENWSPLMALALRIGPAASKSVAETALSLTASAPPAASNLALLRDIRDLGLVGARAAISSSDLLAKLTADPERAWASAYHGRALTPRNLAERLANFGIRPHVLRADDGKVARGYRGTAFIDAFARYLGDIAPAEDILEASNA